MDFKDNIRRVTPYVPGEQPTGSSIIKLNTNENPYPPSPKVAAVLRDFDTNSLRKYPDPDITAVTDALSEFYGISGDKIFAGIGSDDVLALSFMTFFCSEKPIFFADITYSFYPVWCELFGIPFKKIPVRDDFTINPEDYKAENGGIVIANPNAPTTLAMDLADIEGLVAANPGSVVIVDEAYVDFGGDSARGLIDRYENLLVVGTFSKSRSLAGSRVGFAFGSRTLIDALKAVKFSFNSYTMDAVTIKVAAAAVSDREYFESETEKIIATRARAAEELRELGFEMADSSTNFLFATHPKYRAKDLFEMLKTKGIYVRYFNQDRIDNYLRITVGTDEEMDVLIRTLKEYMGVS